ncbi:hypothetical protein H2204_002849 [Knufia peltigerae]|uniref:Glucose-methanol-choline oxidoreductase N-terminal domain-containing protein n=1 Tax=Knufia peltigerae TaxID=1002370 RepID=A0AA39D2E2_9EURO|nr:hypothetical protein H2204_002849 [Knufia peltigerae]
MPPPVEEEFDFIVVGAGNAGAVVAGNLARSKAKPRVLLIELGGDNSAAHLRIPSERFINPYVNPNIVLDYKTTPQKHLNGRVLDYLRGTGLGGSSIANFLAYIRGTASDYNRWADLVDDDSWRWENVLERYNELENLHFSGGNDDADSDPEGYVKLKPGAHGFDGPVDLTLPSRKEWPEGLDILMRAAKSHGLPLNPDQNSGDIIGMAGVTTTTHAGWRVTSASAYLTNPPSNLVLWTNSAVTQVVFDTNTTSTKQQPRASGVILSDGRQVRATKEVILSLGTIDTPKLLMLSGIGDRTELEKHGISCLVNSPRVGKDLIDHVYLVMTYGAKSTLGTKVAFQQNKEYVKAAREQWLRNQTGPDATLNTINIIGFLKFDSRRINFDEMYKLDSKTRNFLERPDVPQYEFYMQGYIPDDWDVEKHGPECLGMAVMLMNPQSRGYVALASKDPLARPIIETNYLGHPYDRQTINNAVKEAMSFAKSKQLSPYLLDKVLGPESDSDEHVTKFVKDELMSILHGVGTVMMGPKHEDTSSSSFSPCDTDFRVRGVDGLRVIDLSVCPTITK